MAKESRVFIKALWGEKRDQPAFRRRDKMNCDIEFTMHQKHHPPFIVYVFGKENYKQLIDLGLKCVLMDDNPFVWDMQNKQFRHKLEIFKVASQEYDEVVFTDWDMACKKPIDNYFWEELAKRESFQAALRMYHRRRAVWRPNCTRMIPCGSMNYLRGPKPALDLIKVWEEYFGEWMWSEEMVMAKYTDDLMGGWKDKKNLDEFWDKFEIPFFYVFEAPVYTQEQYKTKTLYFEHCNQKTVWHFLGRLKNHSQPDWMK